MREDGAHLGYGMDAALRGVMGGEEPPKRMSNNEMLDYIMSAPEKPDTYDDYGRAVAKLVLEFMQRHPETAQMPADSEGEFGKKPNGDTDWEDYHIITEGLYDYIKRVEPDWKASNNYIFTEMSGFMWGWGVNAARSCLELPPVPNPAILTIG